MAFLWVLSAGDRHKDTTDLRIETGKLGFTILVVPLTQFRALPVANDQILAIVGFFKYSPVTDDNSSQLINQFRRIALELG